MVCERCGRPRPPETIRFCSKRCANRSRPRRPPADRFWAKVQKSDGCWTWTGTLPAGAAWFGANPYRPTFAYRFSWVIHYGRIPKGLFVCHHCDNRACVRPDHLFLGTQLDNMRDAKAKGRVFNLARFMRQHPERRRPAPGRRGEANSKAKLTDADVLYIRNAWPAESLPALSRRFGVAIGIVWSVVHGKTWQHVGGTIHPVGPKTGRRRAA